MWAVIICVIAAVLLPHPQPPGSPRSTDARSTRCGRSRACARPRSSSCALTARSRTRRRRRSSVSGRCTPIAACGSGSSMSTRRSRPIASRPMGVSMGFWRRPFAIPIMRWCAAPGVHVTPEAAVYVFDGNRTAPDLSRPASMTASSSWAGSGHAPPDSICATPSSPRSTTRRRRWSPRRRPVARSRTSDSASPQMHRAAVLVVLALGRRRWARPQRRHAVIADAPAAAETCDLHARCRADRLHALRAVPPRRRRRARFRCCRTRTCGGAPGRSSRSPARA